MGIFLSNISMSNWKKTGKLCFWLVSYAQKFKKNRWPNPFPSFMLVVTLIWKKFYSKNTREQIVSLRSTATDWDSV